jgi:hypothetical protein
VDELVCFLLASGVPDYSAFLYVEMILNSFAIPSERVMTSSVI